MLQNKLIAKVFCFTLLLLSSLVNAKFLDISKNVTITKASQDFDNINKILFVDVNVANNSQELVEIGSRLVISNSNFSVVNQDGIDEKGNPFFVIREEITFGDTKTIRVNFPVQRGMREQDTKKKSENDLSRQRARAVFDALIYGNKVDVIENPEGFPSGVKGIVKTDLKGNIVTTYAKQNIEDKVIKIKEGIDYGKPDNVEILTNGFIEITYSPANKVRKIVSIKSLDEFNTVMVYDPENEDMVMTPYIVNDRGEVEFRVMPNDGKVIFSLIYISE